MLPTTFHREFFLAFLSSLAPLSFSMELNLFFPCSRSDPPLYRQGTPLTLLASRSFHDLVIWTVGSVPFPFAEVASQVLAN